MEIGFSDIAVGSSDFAEIRKNGYYYVDKSRLISELIKNQATKVSLVTRPRRFGKTLGMSMLAEFFDIRKDSRTLFENLEISKDQELCGLWMNQWPTLFLSLKAVDGLGFAKAYGMLKIAISELCIEHAYLAESEKVDVDDRQTFLRLKSRTGDESDVCGSLKLLTRMMQAHFNRPVIILLDEYDVPIAKANDHHYYDAMLDLIKSMMNLALKDNPFLKFAVVTGCLRIAKESIFSGMNNFVSDTISDQRFNEHFGFTEDEVDRILEDTGLADKKAEIKDWYDGYRFGKLAIYCPWDVMNYVKDHLQDPCIAPKSYWENTSDNSIIKSFIERTDFNVTEKFEALLSGRYIIQKITENLTYDMLHASEENLWSVLYLTGYLTRADVDGLPEGSVALEIPNREIMQIFRTTVVLWFEEQARQMNRKALFDAAWNGDSEALSVQISSLLRRTISYYDYREDFYHAFLAGIFAGAGYNVDSNRERGEGRSDIVIKDEVEGRVILFEVKSVQAAAQMETACQSALSQIREKNYAEALLEDYETVRCYGIAFYKKRCCIRCFR